MSSLSTLPKGDSAWLLRKSIQRIMQQVSVLETNIGSSTTGNSANTQVIFNDAGTLRGDTGLTYDKSADRLSFGAGICYGLLTSASATITGDLTVDTSTLKVDSANNRVGIGTVTPSSALHMRNASGTGIFTQYQDTGGINYVGIDNGVFRLANTTAQDLLTIAQSGVFEFLDGAGGTRMTLNSTGLGVGASPTRKLSLVGSGATYANINSGDNTSLVGLLLGGTSTPSAGQVIYDNTANSLALFTSGASRLLIDSSGNVGIGVTPSAWSASFKALQIGNQALWSVAGGNGYLSNNTTFNTSNAYVYRNNGFATEYIQSATNGVHAWFNAPSGTAGQTTTVTSGNSYTITAAGGTNYTTFGAANNNVGTTFTASSSGTGNGGGVTQNITFTQAMTLDASGTLAIGTVALGFTSSMSSYFTPVAGYWIGNHATGTASGERYWGFGYGVNEVGSITQNGTTGVLYNITSDYRLKEQVQPLVGGLARVNALKPSVYKWKSDGSNGEGFLAHELAEVVPFAVSGEKDAVNEDGSIKSQGIDMSRVVPILVAAIQELAAEVNALKNA